MRERPDIESDLADLALMAQCTDMLMELFVKQIHAFEKEDSPVKKVVLHLDYWERAASFAVLQTKVMAEKLEKTYLGE